MYIYIYTQKYRQIYIYIYILCIYIYIYIHVIERHRYRYRYRSVLVVHLVELIDEAHAVVRQDHGAALQGPVAVLVPIDGRRQPDAAGTLGARGFAVCAYLLCLWSVDFVYRILSENV